MGNSNIPFRTMIDLVEAANRIGGDRQDMLDEAVEYKINDPRLVKAARDALPPKHSTNPQTVTKMAQVMWHMWAEGGGSIKIGELARLARVRLGISEEAEPVSEDLSSGMFGEYRLERANNPLVEAANRIDEMYFDIQNPTLEKVIDYIKSAVRFHRGDKSDLEYAIEDLEKVRRALEAILKTKGK